MGTVPVPYVPTAGADATQARVLTWADGINYQLGNATSGGSKKPLCVLTQTIAQSIPNNTFTAVTFDSELVDYDNSHSTVTNTSRFTALTAGWHNCAGSVGVAANATGFRTVALRVNGATYKAQTAGPATTVQSSDTSVSCLVYLNAGDYLELCVIQSSGGALNTAVTNGNPTLSVWWTSN